MSGKSLVTEFNQGLDLIVKGDSFGFKVLDEENQILLKLASKIRGVDYSGDSKIRLSLKRQLLERLQGDNELSDKELDWAAGGLDDIPEKNNPEI